MTINNNNCEKEFIVFNEILEVAFEYDNVLKIKDDCGHDKKDTDNNTKTDHYSLFAMIAMCVEKKYPCDIYVYCTIFHFLILQNHEHILLVN